jgi:hypothetical protein
MMTNGPTFHQGTELIYQEPRWSNMVLDVPFEADANWSQVVLSMPMDGANNGTVFTELKAVTPYGAPVTKTTPSHTGTASLYVNGSSALKVANSADFVFGSGDFTVEAWIYPTSESTLAQDILYYGNDGNNTDCWFLRYYGRGAGSTYGDLSCAIYQGVTPSTVYFSQRIKVNAWNHVALVRNGTSLYSIVNGVCSSVTTTSMTQGTPILDSPGLAIGREYHQTYGAAYFTGYINDVRVTKGVARYVAGVNQPLMTPFPQTTTTYTDLKGHVISAGGTAALTNTTHPLGSGYCATFNGAGDYFTTPYSTEWEFGTGDFSVECWFRCTGTTTGGPYGNNQSLISHWSNVLGWAWEIVLDAALGGLYLRLNGGTPTLTIAQAISINTWYHVAFNRTNGVVRGYLNGVRRVETTFADSITASSAALTIGCSTEPNTWHFKGQIYRPRVCKGAGMYPVPFLPYWRKPASW